MEASKETRALADNMLTVSIKSSMLLTVSVPVCGEILNINFR